ncbi:MAG: hypothetical protein ACREUM_03460 [Nitrosospira sp.]
MDKIFEGAVLLDYNLYDAQDPSKLSENRMMAEGALLSAHEDGGNGWRCPFHRIRSKAVFHQIDGTPGEKSGRVKQTNSFS